MTITDPRELGTVLGVWAHPDDEAFLSAGVMAAAVRAGSRVVCVTATRGEEGSQDLQRWPPETMGKVREAEMERCMEILGVADHRWLDHHDGRCAQVPLDEGIALVTGLIQEVQPDSVLTFGPDGMTDHADHKAVSAWTTAAFARGAKPGARLFYATQTQDWADRWTPVLEPFNVFAPGTPPVTPRERLGIAFSLDAELADLKVAGLEAHISQIEGMLAVFGRDGMRESNLEEVFALAAQA